MWIERHRWWIWAAAYLATCALPATGQEILPSQEQVGPAGEPTAIAEIIAPAEQQGTWDFEQLAALAVVNNPTLQQAAAAVAQTQATQWQVGLYPNPQVGYLRADPSEAGQSRTEGVFIGQEFVTSGKRWKSRDVEAQEVARLRWEYQSQERRVLNDVRIRVVELLAAQQTLAMLNDLLRIADDSLKTTERLREGGSVSQADVLQTRIQWKTVRVRRMEAEVRLDAAWRQLVNVVGCPYLERAPIAGQLEGEIPILNWELTWQRLLAESPQLRAAETRINHARSELVREQAQRIPNVTVQVISERDHAQGFNTVSTFVAVPVPLFNRNQGNIAHAEADIREARSEVRRTQLALRDQLSITFQRYETLRRQLEQLAEEIMPDVEANQRLVAAGFRGGEMSMLQLLTAQEAYFTTRLTQLEALVELRKTEAEIDGLLLTGGLNPAALGTALQSQPGAGPRQGLLNQLREDSSRQILPPAFQAGP
jgi:cobalt-zinc-cadmium efflux system outer membrane protein